MVGYFVLSLLGSLLLGSSTLGATLVANRVKTKLPSPMAWMSVSYDGESDYIYLVGGFNTTMSFDSILRFDISTEAIEQVGSLAKRSWGSPLETDSNGNLVFFDGQNSPYVIYKYNIAENSLKAVGESSVKVDYAASIKDSAGDVLLLGGGNLGNDIWKYSVESPDVVYGGVVGQNPVQLYPANAVKVANNTALVFGALNAIPYFKLNLETLETKLVAMNSFPEHQIGMTVTNDRDNVYIFGGNLKSAGIPFDGIIQLDPISQSWNFTQVLDFPLDSGHYYTNAPEVVWVEKLNRIYMFGGQKISPDDTMYVDEIFFIDMNPINPKTASNNA